VLVKHKTALNTQTSRWQLRY